MSQKQKLVVGSLSLATLSLVALKKYMSGGKCAYTPDLTGKVAVITGGNSGIGKETARKLVSLNCRVIIGARDEAKNESTTKQFLLQYPDAEIFSYHLDLASKESIEEFSRNVVKNIEEGPNQVNFLINNAGVMSIPERKLTADGFQMQMGVNHFGHFYLTSLLWKNLLACGSPRIINLSSIAHRNTNERCDINFNDLNFDRLKYDEYFAYVRSKLANILFTKQLQRRMDEAGVHGVTISVHPGMVRTDISRYFVNSLGKKVFFAVTSPLQWLLMKSSSEGAQTSLFGCLADIEDLQGGSYYADCKLAKIDSDQGNDPEAAKILWSKSEEMLGVKFDI